MTKENEDKLSGGEDRRLPKLKKGMRIKYSNYGEANVLADESIGSCVVEFDGGKGRNSGIRDIHMGIGHKLIEILKDE